MYQALYRKYRPRSFSDVIGQDHITETLRGQIKTDRLTHAYLFVGTRGTGKTTCAKILSRAVNCLNPTDGNPCNECASCKGIEDGTILDVLEIDGASNNKVDDARELRGEAIYSPASVKKRVYIIDEVHMLTKDAFNALLKILEEPPEHLLFILATTELHKVLPTIQSRCQKFSFRRLPVEKIAERLSSIATNEALTLTADAAKKLAILADGSMRDGISLLDQCVSDKTIDLALVQDTLGLSSEHELLGILQATAAGQTATMLDILDKLHKDGKDMAALLSELAGIMRDLLIIRITEQSHLLSSGLSETELKATAELFSTKRLFSCLEAVKGTMSNLSRTGISKTVLELCLIGMSNTGDSAGDAIQTAPAPKPVVKTPVIPAPQPKPEPSPEPETKQEPVPEPESSAMPAPEPEPVAQPAVVHTGDTDLLSDILTNVDDMTLKLTLSAGAVTDVVSAGNVVTLIMAEKQDLEYISKDALQEAINKTFGKEMEVRITEKPDMPEQQ